MHQHKSDKIVRDILEQIANESKRPFNKVKKLFIRGNLKITEEFWNLIHLKYTSHHFIDVYHCPCCGKFDLE